MKRAILLSAFHFAIALTFVNKKPHIIFHPRLWLKVDKSGGIAFQGQTIYFFDAFFLTRDDYGNQLMATFSRSLGKT